MPKHVKHIIFSIATILLCNLHYVHAGRTQIAQGEITSEVKKPSLLVRWNIKRSKSPKKMQLGSVNINSKYSKILRRLHAQTKMFDEYQNKARMAGNERSVAVFESHKERTKRNIKAIRKAGHHKLTKSKELSGGY